MGPFTFQPVWVTQDLLTYVAAMITVFYIVRTERRPTVVLTEMFAFVLLDAAVFENLATVERMYGYGKSMIMVFNVPLSVPLFEFMILYASLRLLAAMRMPMWTRPILAGFLAVIADFTLDPVAVKQIFSTAEGTIGRWTWFTKPGAVRIYGEPVSNFTGWMLIIGLAAAFFLLGRWWHRRSGYSAVVGYVYPVLAALASLLVLVTPLASFVLNLWPLFKPGGDVEFVMLAVVLVVPTIILAVYWKPGRTQRLSLRTDFALFAVLGGFPAINLLFCVFGGYWQILWLVALACVALWVTVFAVYRAGRRTVRRDAAERAGSDSGVKSAVGLLA